MEGRMSMWKIDGRGLRHSDFVVPGRRLTLLATGEAPGLPAFLR